MGIPAGEPLLKLEIYAEAEDRLEALRAEGRSLSIEAAVSEALPALD